jgi:hypothetical protein
VKKVLNIIMAMAVLPVWAQDQGFGFDSGEDSSGGFGFDSGDDGGFGFDDAAEDPLSIGVDLELASRYYLLEEGDEYSLDNLPAADLNFAYLGDSSEAVFNLKFAENLIQNDPGRVIDEAYFRWFVDSWDFQIGLFKTTWGKGDGVHVLDVLNPKDYSDLNNVDPLDAKIAEAMIKANVGIGDNGRLELVYQPFFTPDTVPLDGRWAPGQFVDVQAQLFEGAFSGDSPEANGGLGNGIYYALYSQALTISQNAAYRIAYEAFIQVNPGDPAGASAAGTAAAAAVTLDDTTLVGIEAQATAQALTGAEEAIVLPDTVTLEYSSGGLRYTDTFGILDLGLQYFTGFWRRPVVDQNVAANDGQLLVSYNRFHQAGLDFGFVLGPLNFRGEVAG